MAEQKNINNKIEKENVSDEKSDNEKMLPKIINEKITAICIYIDKVYYILVKEDTLEELKEVFEDVSIKKVSMDFSKSYIILKQKG